MMFNGRACAGFKSTKRAECITGAIFLHFICPVFTGTCQVVASRLKVSGLMGRVLMPGQAPRRDCFDSFDVERYSTFSIALLCQMAGLKRSGPHALQM
jgi:hypothetical protein